MKYTNILVAVDGSKESTLAFEKAVAVAKRNNATLHIAHVIDLSAKAASIYGFTYTEQTVENISQTSEEMVQSLKEKALAEGIEEVHTLVEFGSPKTVLTKEIAPSIQCDLIMCGAHGLNLMERFMLGSVSENIVRTAKCDVLIVRSK